MAIDLNSEDARLIRGFIPINTLPGYLFDELCATQEVLSIDDGEELFTQGSIDTDYYFLLSGSAFLEAGKTEVDTVEAGTEAARFALAHHIPRKVTCIAQDSVRYLKVDSENFSQETVSELLQKSDLIIDDENDDEVNEEIIPFLLKAPLFRQLFVSILPGVSSCLEKVTFEAEQIVIEQGSPNNAFYIIQDGCCQVTHRPFENAKEIQLDDLQQGDAFGEYALLIDGRSDITVKTSTDCVMFSIDEEAFERWIKQPLLSQIDWKNADKSGDVFLDIQSLEEYRKNHIKGSINYPFSSLRVRLGQLSDSSDYIVVSDDEQSNIAALIMLRQRELKGKILTGGLAAVPEGSLDHILIADSDETRLSEENDNIDTELLDEELTMFAPAFIGSPIKAATEKLDAQQSSEAMQQEDSFAQKNPQSELVEVAKVIDSVYNSVLLAEGDSTSLKEESFDAGVHIKRLESKLQEIWKAYKKTRNQLQKSKRRYTACYREYNRIEESYHGMLLDSSPSPSGEINSGIDPAISADDINLRLREEFSQITILNKKLKKQVNLLKEKLEEHRHGKAASNHQQELNTSRGNKDAIDDSESLHVQINELERTVQLLEQKKSIQQMKAKQYVNENEKLRALIQELAKQAIDEQSQDNLLSTLEFSTEFASSDSAYAAEIKTIEQIKDELYGSGEYEGALDGSSTSDNHKKSATRPKKPFFSKGNNQKAKTWISIIGSCLLTLLLIAILFSTEKGQALLQQIGF